MSQSTYQPPPGRLGNLTPEQQAALDRFRTDLKADANFPWNDERHSDPHLLRFLRARKFNLDASKTMIYNCEQWRKDFGVDELIKNFKLTSTEQEAVNKYYPQYYHKTDKEGRPIYVEVLGQLNVTELNKKITSDRLIQRFVLEYERFLSQRLPAASAAIGHPVETSCTILDLNNVGIMSFYSVKDIVAQMSKIGQDYYPECMGKFYIINAPYLFSGVWTIIKPWLDPVTVAKIQITSGNPKDVLLKQIEPQNLPKAFGGVCSCEGGCSLSDAGPWHEHPTATTSAEPPAPASTS